MRLSEWRKSAPNKDSMSATVLAAIESVAAALGAGPDPHAWVVWGDDPMLRYSILVPTRGGLAVIGLRAQTLEGPRASGKLVRWSRLQLSELTVESQEGHRLVATQIEGSVLRGVDAEADAIAEFVRGLIAAADGREWQPPADAPKPAPRTAGKGPAKGPAKRPAAKPPATKPGAPKAASPGSRPRRSPGSTGGPA